MELAKEKYYTYTDYLTWGDERRYELIEGVPFAMSPAPSWIHQKITGEIFRQLANFLDGKPCEVFTAPFDVRLNAEEDDDTVVQPDITIVCDKSKLEDKGGCKGTPDMLIEIVSPASAKRDRIEKLQLYQRAGVREYWIVDPDTTSVQVYILKDDDYIITVYKDAASVPVRVLEGCEINLAAVFKK